MDVPPQRPPRVGLVGAAVLAPMLMALIWCYVTALSTPSTGTYHDDGVYLVTAQSLANGDGYRIGSLPDRPPQTKYPILFPWLLSLVWRAIPTFPDNLPWLRLVPLLSAAGWLALSVGVIRRMGGSLPVATGIAVLTAVSPAVLYFSTALLSETLFAALLTATVWMLSKTSASQLSVTRCAFAGAIAGACILTRIAGAAVVIGLLAWLLLGGNRRGALWFAAVAAAFTAPWAMWAAEQVQVPLDPYYSAAPYGSWNIIASYNWTQKLQVLATNLLFLVQGPMLFWGIPLSAAAVVVSLAMTGPLIVRGWWLTRHQPGTWCAASVVAMNLLWVWPPFRLTIPIAPLLMWSAFTGMRGLRSSISTAVAGGLVVVSSVASVQAALHARTIGSLWAPSSLAEDWRRISPLLEWVRSETPPNAILAGNLDPMYFLYTGRRSLRAFSPDSFALYYAAGNDARQPLGSVEDLRSRFIAGGIDYCIWTPAAGFGESQHFRRLLNELAERYPGSLVTVNGSAAEGYVVYRVVRGRLQDFDGPSVTAAGEPDAATPLRPGAAGVQ
jgi:hypothetical protein